MAIITFSFSGVYKDALISKQKTASIVLGDKKIGVGESVLVTVSDEDNLYDGNSLNIIGTGVIKKEEVKLVKDIDEGQAKRCSYNNISELKEGLKHWYDADDRTVVTYFEFDIEFRGETNYEKSK
ncbi:MAG: hypothetical protein A2Y24_04920 [Clostridiales bacterium GWE2_32_10]|nr:MAG: hypothetical protein A2Y24_04920 [Clostridiales bacterium GWE2_32_10]HBY20288.1 hypothetical protein [Clostridiales bacterium]